MWLKDQLDELKYLRSANNTTSRGFYMMIWLAMIISVPMLLLSIILVIAGVVTGMAAGLSIGLSAVVALLSWGVFIYMALKG